jgi:hypothetical protein
VLDCHFGVAVGRGCRRDYFSLNLIFRRIRRWSASVYGRGL